MAETYDAPIPDGIQLTDATADVNRYINEKLALARGKARSSPALEAAVYKQLGDAGFSVYAPIEKWANGLEKATGTSPGKIYQPNQDDSQYKGLGITSAGSHLAPVMLVNGILIGTDKLGHFFQLGYSHYYSELLKGKDRALVLTEGDKSEAGIYGVVGTGVYSKADIAANRAGMQFYQDLAKNPGMAFRIESYIDFKWNEASNENLYGEELANMWAKNLTGAWKGHSLDAASNTISSCSVNLKATIQRDSSYVLTGIYGYSPTTTIVDGKLRGTITNHLNSDNAVDRVDVSFDWEEGANRGKGTMIMVGMNQLTGQWGSRHSAYDGGTWTLHRVR